MSSIDNRDTVHAPARTQTGTEARRADSKSEVLAFGVATVRLIPDELDLTSMRVTEL